MLWALREGSRTANITDMRQIISNHESLNADEKARVPDQYYRMARIAIPGTPENTISKEVQAAESKPKN